MAYYALVARTSALKGDFTTLPEAFARAGEVDRAYYSKALCRTVNDTPKLAWVAEPSGKYRLGENAYRGEKLIEMALTVCAVCPVQWTCARAAIDGDERAGTWAAPMADLRWLRAAHPKQWRTIVDVAEAEGIPVHVAIRTARGLHM